MSQENLTKILLAEDSKFFISHVENVVSTYFENIQVYKVQTLGMIEKNLSEIYPDIMILDLYFPDGDSLEKIASIKEEYPDLEIIVTSGQSDIRIALQSIKEGADHYIVKDAGFNSDLLVALNTVFDKLTLKKQLKKISDSIFNGEIYPFVVFKASDIGSELVYKDFQEFPEVLEKSTDEFLIGLGLTILVGLGQGHLYHEGCYSYPAGDSNFYSLLVFTIRIVDPHAVDARLSLGYYQFVLFVPNSFWSMFPAASDVSFLIDDIKELVPDTTILFNEVKFIEIKNLILNGIKSHVLQFRQDKF